MRARAFLVAMLLAACALGGPAVHAQRAPSPPAEVTVAQLPAEAQKTVALINKGGPYPYARDGSIFANREGRLPNERRGYYREYTVRTPGERTRGARRIVAGAAGELWYSDDHYTTFRRIRP